MTTDPKIPQPNFAPGTRHLLAAAISRCAAQARVLAMLTVVVGAVYTIVNLPLVPYVDQFVAALAEVGGQPGGILDPTPFIQIYSDAFPTLLAVTLITITVNACALVPWARLILAVPGGALSGGGAAIGRRMFLGSWHLLSANLLVFSLFVLFALILAVLQLLGPILATIGEFVGLFFAIALIGGILIGAHLALLYAAKDQPISLPKALGLLRLAIPGLLGAAAISFVVVVVVSFIVAAFLVGILPERLGYVVGNVIVGGSFFLVSAMIIAALSSLPSPEDFLGRDAG